MSHNIINKKIPNVEKEQRLLDEFKEQLKKDDPTLYEKLKDLNPDEMVRILSAGL